MSSNGVNQKMFEILSSRIVRIVLAFLLFIVALAGFGSSIMLLLTGKDSSLSVNNYSPDLSWRLKRFLETIFFVVLMTIAAWYIFPERSKPKKNTLPARKRGSSDFS